MPEGLDCAACHRTDAWQPLRAQLDFDHNQQTPFPLTGSHEQTRCATCHVGMRFDAPKVETNDCASCHLDVHQGEFADRCVDCHNTTSFQGVEELEVHNRTRFPLTGAHAQVSCESCHRTDEEGAFSLLDTECLACHEPDYAAAHGAAGFPTTCESCHTTLAWAATPAFDHAALSGGFALLGAHEPLACVTCHREPGFQPLFAATDQEDCASCHQQDYQQQHAGTGFTTQCLDCHTIDTWEGAVFDHALIANGFALLGTHEALACATCHAPPPDFTPLFAPADDQDCYTCHQDDYQQQHAGSGFPTQCAACHSVDNWDNEPFDHGSVANGFALLGAHEPLDCATCHAPPPGFEPLFAPADQDDCLTCHQDDYQQQHAADGFPTTCQTCHTLNTWDNEPFDHGLVANGFALLGAHDVLDCSTCHAPPPDFTPLFNPSDDQDCFTCHQNDYQQQHGSDGFPYTCVTCHNNTDWRNASFSHSNSANGFRLLGAHDALPCSTCHAPPPDFSPLFTPSDDQDCFTCHQSDYQQQHAAEGFPTTCVLCHDTNDWGTTTFDHNNDFFPIFSGRHEDEWNTCMDCHIDSNDFSLFSCLTCHEHNQPDMDDKHEDDPGYVYESSACFTCHPTGEK